MIFESDRLRLRHFRAEDAPALAAYRSDPDVARYQAWSAPVPLEDARKTVEYFATADPDAPGWFQYAIETRADDRLIGDVGVRLHENLMQAEIGYTLAAGEQGRGYGSEAVRTVLADLFERRGLHRVSAECDARNLKSARLLERLGFRLEGVRPECTWIKDEWTDDLLFGLLRRTWTQSHG